MDLNKNFFIKSKNHDLYITAYGKKLGLFDIWYFNILILKFDVYFIFKNKSEKSDSYDQIWYLDQNGYLYNKKYNLVLHILFSNVFNGGKFIQ
jgi:hypothetical protein